VDDKWNKVVTACFKALSQPLPGEHEETHDKPQLQNEPATS